MPTLPDAALASVLVVVAGGSALAAAGGSAGPAWPDVYPAGTDLATYAGAASCAPCHEEQYAAWELSPHGRAMGEAAAGGVLGRFDGTPTSLPDGAVRPLVERGRVLMEMETAAGRSRHPVTHWLGSGRQHQVYLSRGADGVLRLLPLLWSTLGERWIPLVLYQPAVLDPSSPAAWSRQDILRSGCFNCHLSQATFRVGAGGMGVEWVDLPVNCEACHGPGRVHVEERTAGRDGPPLVDLAATGKEEEGRLCGVCHGARVGFSVWTSERGLPECAMDTLAYDHLRVDATQGNTSYQYAGHVSSLCYRRGALQCRHCHDPHDCLPRALDGQSAIGLHSDRQCTVCHRNYLGRAAAHEHSRHQSWVRCIDCHMGMSWIMDSPRTDQRTSDHTISTPRPLETILFGTPNACATCHRDRDAAWALAAMKARGRRESLGVRPWVQAVFDGRRRAPEATERLLAVLADEDAGPYLHDSALALLGSQPSDASVAGALEPHAAHPHPWTRGLAIQALVHHDAAGAADWRRRGLADAHGIVRMMAFPLGPEARLLPARALAQFEADSIAWRPRPSARDMAALARVRLLRGEHEEARGLVARIDGYASPSERADPRWVRLRSRLEAPVACEPDREAWR